MIRLGLCCKFSDEPIRFRVTTATAMLKLSRDEQLERLSLLCAHNASALAQSIAYCCANGIGAFRINSQVLPLKTHPAVGYAVRELPRARQITEQFIEAGRLASREDVRLSFHPDQFIVLSSADEDLTARSICELEYQAEVAEWVRADVINLHGGGAYGEPETALQRVEQRINALPSAVRQRLTLENDDRVYTPEQLLPLCRRTGTPMVYDVHHHRAKSDELSITDATQAALDTWNREPLFHISSPINGWEGAHPSRHHDFIDFKDVPEVWRKHDLTLDVEAKAKEHAVARLRSGLRRKGWSLWSRVAGR